MYTEYFVGFIFGMVAMLCLMKIAKLLEPDEEQKGIDCWVNKPVIHEEHLYPCEVTVTKDIPFEELSHTNDKYNERFITDSLKLKMMEKLWEYVRVTEEKDPKWFCYRYHATIRVLLPSRDALRYELTKQES